VAFSRQLALAHRDLRDRLTRIRRELALEQPAETDLLVHCLTFCSALAAHHGGEDDGPFRDLLDSRPDLAPAIRKLTEDHAAIAVILRQVRDLAGRADATPAEDLPRLRRELDGLAAIAESHFRYEERAVSAALDHVGPADRWSRAVFRPTERPDPQR
jgi:Hemerythrin HHE cation binding domain